MVRDSGLSDIIGVILLIAVVTVSMGIVGIMVTKDINPVKVPHVGFLACNNSTKVFLYHTGGDAIIPDQLHSDIEIRFLDRDKRAIHSEWIQEPWFTSRVLNYSYPSGAQYTQLIVPSGSGDSLIEWTEIKPCVGTYIPRPGPGPGPGPGGECPSVSISGTITESGTGNPEPGITVNAYYEGEHSSIIGAATSGSDGSYSINLPLTGNLEQYDIHCPDTGTWQTTIPASKWHYGIVIDQSSGSACNPAGYDFEGTYTGTPGLTVTSPNGGEKFAVGSIQTISWTVEHISPDHFSIEYSIDNGNNWNSIGSSVSGILRNFEWTVPNTPTEQALVRVTAGDSLGNTLAGDTSDSVFTIFNPDCYRISGQVLNQVSGNPVGGIRVNAYYQDEHSTIIGNADTTGDGRYTILLPATGNLELYDIYCPDTGTWQTTIPASKWHYGIVIDPSSSTQCHPDGVDFQGRIIVSPVLEVTSPNGGEDWVVGTEHQITWSVENVDAASYRIEYSIDSGVNWILIDDAVSGSSVSYSWTLPETPSELALIRVIAKESSGTTIIEDDSDNVFTISAPCIKTISATAGDHGSISPSGTVEAPCGLDQLFTITADACYGIESVTIDGVPISGTFDSPYTYTFPSVQSDHTIHATFTPITYTITATAGDHGSISPSGTVEAPCGLDQSFTITADPCYGIESVTIDGVPISGTFDSPYTYTFPSVQSAHTIHATFTPITYTITATAGDHGSISPAGSIPTNCGTSPSFTITPNTGYSISDVIVNGISVGAVSEYTFPPVYEDQTIHATFTEDCPPPIASFIASARERSRTVTFTDTSTGSVTTWLWNFGDGTTSTQQNPVKTYSSSGIYLVTLTVSGLCGSDSNSQRVKTGCWYISGIVTLTPGPLSPRDLTIVAIGDKGNRYTVTPFSDGTYLIDITAQSSEKFTVSVLNCPGVRCLNYSISPVSYTDVQITPGLGKCSSTNINFDLTYNCPPVTASFIAVPSNGNAPLTVQFTDTSTGYYELIEWNFGDGNTGTGSPITHQYLIPGTYTATMTLSGYCGGATDSGTIVVTGGPGFTAYGWLRFTKPPSPPATNEQWATLVVDGDRDANRIYQILHNQDNTRFEMFFRTNGANGYIQAPASFGPVSNVPYFLVASYNQADGRGRLYVNGVLAATYMYDTSGLAPSPGLYQVGGSNGIYWASSSGGVSDPGQRRLSGDVGGVGTVNRVMLLPEIQVRYNEGPPW